MATSSAIELRGGFLRTTELLQWDLLQQQESICPNMAEPNTQTAADWCHHAKGLYGVDFNDCMQDYKAKLESWGVKNGFVGYYCNKRFCKRYLPADGSVGVE